MINLIHGDALEEMQKMIEVGVKVDCIVTDPPYNISKDNNFNTMGRAGIDFGEWDKGADILSYIKLLDKLTNKNASVIIFNDWKNLGDIARELENNGFVVKDMVRWRKSNPMPRNLNRRYVTDFECFIWAVKKGAKWTFEVQSNGSYDRCEIECALTPKREKKFGAHATQKPVALMENIIARHTMENDIVLDMFMGSGSTGVACKNLNRKFIGIELDEGYYNIAKERIEEIKND